MKRNVFDGEEFPQDQYFGRLRKMFLKTNPYFIFTSKKSFERSRKLLNDCQNPEYDTGEISKKDYWKAKHIVGAYSCNGKKVPLPFRLCSFVPVNILVVLGVLNSRSILGTIFWQSVNQTYNVCLNFSYRGSKEEMTTNQIMRNYMLAVTSSCGTAVGLNEWIKWTNIFQPGMKGILLQWVPLVAVCAAQMANISMTRLGELTRGTTVFDSQGRCLGLSKKCGRRAVALTVISRISNACGVFGFVKISTFGLTNYVPFIARNPKLYLPAELLSITLALSLVLPCALSIFKERRRVRTKKIEKFFSKFKNERGEPLEYVYYNKGL